MSKKPTFQFALREDLKNDKRFLPTRAEEHSSGYDVRAAWEDGQDRIIKPGEYVKIPLGFRCMPSKNWWYQLHPRSSFFVKKHMHTLIGIIDESWEGQTMLVGTYLPPITNLMENLIIKYGEPVGQIIPVQLNSFLSEEISNEEFEKRADKRGYHRKDQGFGSTTK